MSDSLALNNSSMDDDSVLELPFRNGEAKSLNGSPVRSDRYKLAEDKVISFIDDTLGEGTAEFLCWTRARRPDELSPAAAAYAGIANLQRTNDIPEINQMFLAAHRILPDDGLHVICLETMHQRKMRIMAKYPKVFNGVYYFFDFLLKRVFPKWGPTRKIYYKLTGGRNRVLSLTEALGRLMSCGFTIIDYKSIGNFTWFISRKNAEPDLETQPTFGAICRLKRVGYGGEVFTVYKMRTMYPYSEFLQDYVFKRNDLQEGGKLNKDFRVTSWGRLFRRLWIDELPMLINWMKGDMKLVGVRPLSRHYFELYPEDLQKLRTRVRPGLVPPYYADMPQTLDEIIESERKYIYAYLNKPIRTDVRYFFKAFVNIFVRGARSK